MSDPLGRPPDPAFRHPVQPSPESRRTDDPFDRQDESRHRPAVPGQDMFSGARPDHEWVGPSQRDDADAPHHAMPAPRLVAAPMLSEIDFDALIGDLSALQPHGTPASPPRAAPSPPSRPPPHPAARNPFAEFDDLMAPPQPVPPAVPATPAASAAPPPGLPPVPVAPVDGADARAALAAFLEGAGVPAAALGDGSGVRPARSRTGFPSADGGFCARC